ncbi:MAG: AAA family ATPase, partial [Bacteroidales bacterium]|nr:AAA family ATPase [Bacteroidales bacterium]
MFKRDLHQIILDRCFKNKAIILLGARQVGKTTLLKNIIHDLKNGVLYLNCDEPQTVVALTKRNAKELK